MDKMKLGLIGAVSALALPTLAPPAQAAPPVAPATTYAELLEPIPNAVERLKASDQQPIVRNYLEQARRWRRVWHHGHWARVYYYPPFVPVPYFYGRHHHHHHHNHHHHNHW